MPRKVAFKFTAKLCFQMYEMYKNGISDQEIALSVGLATNTFIRKREAHPVAEAACKYGREAYKREKENRSEFDDIVIGRLPEDLRDIWKRIKREAKKPTGFQPIQHMEMRQKQILWVHAWVKFRFNAHKASAFLQIAPRTVNLWKQQASFKKLMEGMLEVKKDFVEDSLLGLIQRANPIATVFAAKTLLRDRGYGEETKITGRVEHAHAHEHHLNINLAELNLPLDVQMIVMEAIERKQKENNQSHQPLLLEHKE